VAGRASLLGGRRLVLLPGLEVSLQLAVVVFALVLGLGAWAGAASMNGGSQNQYLLASSPASSADAGSPLSPDSGSATDLGALPEETASADLPLEDTSITDYTAVTDSPSSGGGGGGGSGGGDDDEPDPYLTPALTSMWTIVLSDQSFEQLYDVGGAATAKASAAAPYLATTLTKQGALIPDLFAVTRGQLANTIALVSGQGAKAQTRLGCPSFEQIAGSDTDDYEQAGGGGCGYGASYNTVLDRVRVAKRQSRLYAGVTDRLPGGAAEICQSPEVGMPLKTGPIPFPVFESFTKASNCADRVRSPSQIGTDLAAGSSAAGLSFIFPGPCENASSTPCGPGQPAGVGPANQFLRRTVTAIMASKAYKAGGAIIITADQSASSGEYVDNSACCSDRPWYGDDQATAGGGRVGALMLSPLIKGGTTVEGSFDHYDLLRTISRSLAVKPAGFAAHPEVTGFPRSLWSGWNGKSPVAAK
jgi:hypothetical protein